MTTVDKIAAPAKNGKKRQEAAQMTWKPVIVKLGELDPWEDNPREINKAHAERLADGTLKFGQVETMAIGPKNDQGKYPIYNGHQRYFTWLDRFGPEHKVQAMQASRPLSTKERQELTVLLHEGAVGEWDIEKLVNWDPLELLEWGFDRKKLIAAGFELDQEEATEDEGPEYDRAQEIRDKWKTEPGQLWILGSHRLLIGDATNPDDFARLMDGQLASICATDPPYFIDYTGVRFGTFGKDYSGTFHDGANEDDLTPFYTAFFSNVIDWIEPKSAIYVWHAHKRQADIDAVWKQLGIHNHQQIIWVKPAPLMGSVFWHYQHECALFGWHPGPDAEIDPSQVTWPEQHEPCLMGWPSGSMPVHDGDHTYSTIWNISFEGKARPADHLHPTQKPVEIFARPIRKHTKVGEICLEPFLGSGSQLIAAEQMRRRCFALEIEPIYAALSIERWNAMTGEQPTLESEDNA